jgi:hypothetical protein
MKVISITKQVAKYVIEAKHYRKTLGIFWYGFALIKDDKLVGVCVFGQPSAPIQKHAFANRDFPLMELTRLVVDDGVKNGASFLIANALKQLNKPCAVISYADSAQGHCGIVYQATNWVYTGAVTAHSNLYRIDGEILHSMTLRDRYGVTNSVAWAKQNDIEIIPPKPKHRYFYFVGSKREVASMKSKLKYKTLTSYPKSNKTVYDSGESCESVLDKVLQPVLF